MTQYLFYYLITINVLTFIIFVFDKQRSIYGGWRIPEKVLWLLSLLGGSLGGIMAMEIARHKRRKANFYLIMYLIILAQAVAIYLLLKKAP
ncbi:DUF1294 domain-containing protein [Candidatus Kuenenbacteria bacterium]|nr:DUF1294 domain-containing protein [Candidatus Kuenenbacteria bacterium]